MIDVYAEFATQVAAMPVVPGRKSRIESFAGGLACVLRCVVRCLCCEVVCYGLQHCRWCRVAIKDRNGLA